jgi:hypothetical protein
MKNYSLTLIIASALTVYVVIIRQKSEAQNTIGALRISATEPAG